MGGPIICSWKEHLWNMPTAVSSVADCMLDIELSWTLAVIDASGLLLYLKFVPGAASLQVLHELHTRMEI